MELLGTIAMMLTGAFPMVTLVRRYLGKPLEKLGRLAELEADKPIYVNCFSGLRSYLLPDSHPARL